jgi:DNA polymerase-3 subunit epsilon
VYAIVDIETTGGHATQNRITEISIYVHNGLELINHFETLIHPEMQIPAYIQAFTGISDEMVSNAPTFSEVAAQIYEVLKDQIFVAHNVNFDHSFIKHQLQECG